ncbi:MAG TPA: T9SS type A sorting domain-containing protein, partial [Puia sp.]
ENDGAGGGGAGGTILIYSNNGVTSNITAKANGGDGGSNEVNGGPSHGPGAGGGGGIIYSNSTLNASSTVTGGKVGKTNGNTTSYGGSGGLDGKLITNMNASAPAQVPMQCIALPVNFLSFTATNRNNTALLSWEVTQQSNVQQYIVERSTDGASFTMIGSVAFKSNPLYQFTDDNLPAAGGTIYYRIRELDIDGQFVYSKIVTIQPGNLAGRLSVYPNPATNSVTVSFSCSNPGAISLRLFDLKGSQLWQQQYIAGAGQNTVQIDYIRNLPTGVYILQWFDGLKPEQTKVLVNH